MLADKLYYGCPPAIDFIYLPLKAGIAECKSSSRRSMWTPYEVYLEPDRLLLYQVAFLRRCEAQQRDKVMKDFCCKSISLKDVELEQYPQEAYSKGLKISSGRIRDSAKFIRFSDDDEYKAWNQVGEERALLSSSYR